MKLREKFDKYLTVQESDLTPESDWKRGDLWTTMQGLSYTGGMRAMVIQRMVDEMDRMQQEIDELKSR